MSGLASFLLKRIPQNVNKVKNISATERLQLHKQINKNFPDSSREYGSVGEIRFFIRKISLLPKIL